MHLEADIFDSLVNVVKITYGLWIERNGFQRMNEPELDYEQRVNNGGRRPLSTSYSTLRCHVKKYEAEKAMPDPLL